MHFTIAALRPQTRCIRRAARRAAAVSLAFLKAKYWYECRRDEARARETLQPLLAVSRHPQHRQIAAYARALTR